MSAKPECPADPGTQIASLTTSPDKHSQWSNALCPSIFHLVRQQPSRRFTFINLCAALTGSCVQDGLHGWRISRRSATPVQPFSEEFQKHLPSWWAVNINFLSFPYLWRLSGTLCVRTASDASKQQWLLLCTSETLNKAVTNWEARYTLDWGWETFTDDWPTQNALIIVTNYV